MGLGNLGQAYLWTLGLLPYAEDELELVLQDFDVVSAANRSTSLLTRERDVGHRKTRLAAGWAEHRGFRTTMIERAFPASRPAHECWPEAIGASIDPAQGTAKQKAYEDLDASSQDRCGVLRLAGRSIATPFTGAVAGALAVGELLRLCRGGTRVEYTALHLGRLGDRTAIPGVPWPAFNPGLVTAATAEAD